MVNPRAITIDSVILFFREFIPMVKITAFCSSGFITIIEKNKDLLTINHKSGETKSFDGVTSRYFICRYKTCRSAYKIP